MPVLGGKAVLLTRAQDDSAALAEKITALGCEALIAPVFDVRPTNIPPPAGYEQADGLIITSAKAVIYAGQILQHFSSKPVFVIGDKTLKELQKIYAGNIFCAHSDSVELVSLINKNCPSLRNGLLHAGGVDISGQFEERIAAAGIPVLRWPVYEAAARDGFAPDIQAALREGRIGTVIFYSARSAKIFEEICEAAGLTASLSHTQALCLAPSVVKSLRRTVWKEIHVSDQPTETAILNHLVQFKSGGEL